MTRFAAFGCLTFILVIHGTSIRWGLRLQNILGVFKLAILGLIVMSGLLCLTGVANVRKEYEQPDNLRWEKLWEGGGTGLNLFVNGLYNVIW